ncbi:MAG: response regulator [Pseudolabrys sp.]
MSGDLFSLRMLVVAGTESEADLWRQGASGASIPIEFHAQDPTAATNTIAKGNLDICVLDGALPDPYKAGVVKAARMSRPSPLVFVSTPHGASRFEGADGMLRKPASAADARKLAEICIRAKIPTRVLIVDDSSTMRSIVRKILSASRFALEFEEATEGFAALSQVRSGKFGLVFLDYNMPGFNGLETLSEIRRESPDVGVVMMTSTVDIALADRARAAGALAFLKKPFFPADIDAVLDRYFGLYAGN